MKMWVALLIVCTGAEMTAGGIRISDLSIHPCTFNASGALLAFNASLQYRMPTASTLLTISSAYPFVRMQNRSDCFIYSDTEVSVKHCESDERTLTATLVSTMDFDMDNFMFVVLRAFDLPQSQPNQKAEIRLTWNDEMMNCNLNVSLPMLEKPFASIRNVTLAIDKAMAFGYTTLRLFFQPDFTIQARDLVYLLFPEEYDVTIAKLKDDNKTIGCGGNLKPDCKLSYLAINAYMNTVGNNETLVNVTVENFRMPANLTDRSIGIYVYRQSDLFAVYWISPIIIPRNLDISCCIQYDRLPENCSDDSLRDCFAFGFNIASFSNDMNQIIARFNQKMEIDGFRKCGARCEDCTNIFDFDRTVARLGADPKCRWTDSDVLTIYLGAYPTITNGRIYFRPGMLHTYKGNLWIVPSMRLIYPKKFPTPTPVINVIGDIYHCEGSRLDCIQTTGTGRRALNCTWFVSGKNATQIDQFLVSNKDAIDEMDVVPVRMEAVNVWGLRADTTVLVPIVRENNLTVSFPFGNFTQFYYSNGFIFQPNIIPSNCTLHDKITSYSFDWTFNDTRMKNNCTGRICSIKKGDLPNGIYSVIFTVYAQGAIDNYIGSVSANFRVLPSPIQLKVLGANCTVNVNETNTFRANATDPDTNQPVKFTWSLMDKDKNYTDLVNIEGYNFTIPKDMMKSKERYYIKVVALTIDRESQSDMYWIDTTEDQVLRITILPSQKANPSGIVKVNPDVPETRLMNVTEIHCRWGQITNHNYRAISYPIAPILVFAAESLDQGLEYVFKYECNATLADGRPATSQAQITININQPPTGGVFEIAPSEGYALETDFFFAGKNWKDNDGDYPLTYQYFTVHPGEVEDTYFPFTPAVLEANFTTRLANTTNTIVLYVCDSLGACSRTRQNVTFYRPRNIAHFDTISNLLSDVQVANDTRSIITTANAISDSISYMVKKRLLNVTDAQDAISNITTLLKNTTDVLISNNPGDLTTAQQEMMLTSIRRAVIPSITTEESLSELLGLLDRIVSLDNTRYTTGPIAVQVLSRLQDYMHFTNVSSLLAVDLTSKVQNFAKKLSQGLVNTLSPGQFPINQSESSMTVYASRNHSAAVEKLKEIQLPINGLTVQGSYSVNLPPDLINSIGSDRVVDIVISALRVPPYSALLQISSMVFCSFSYFQDSEKLNYTKNCKRFPIPLSTDWLDTVYTQVIVRDIGMYDEQTGQAVTSANVTAVSLPAGTKFNQTLPFAFTTYQNLQCFSEDSDGLLTTEYCKLVHRSGLEGTCECSVITGAIIKPVLTVANVLWGWVDPDGFQGGERLISMEFSGAIVVFILAVVSCWSLVNLMQNLDTLDFKQREEAKTVYKDLANELVYKLSNHKKLVEVKMYAMCCCLITYLKLFRFLLLCKTRTKTYSIEELCSQRLQRKISIPQFISGIQSAFSDMKKEPILKWKQCDVMDTFCECLSSQAYCRSTVYTLIQYQESVRKYSQSSALTIPLSKWFIDDLTRRRSYFGRFILNNQILSFFLCRTILFSRVMRIPIILVNLFGPMTSYVLNFNNLNSNRMKTLAGLLIDSKGWIIDSPGQNTTVVVTAIFIAVTFLTEFILMLCSPMEFISEEHNPLFKIPRSKSIEVLKVLTIPLILCTALLLISFIKMLSFGINDTYLVLRETAVGFTGAVVVGFHAVAIFIVLFEDFWFCGLKPLLNLLWEVINIIVIKALKGLINSAKELVLENFGSEEYKALFDPPVHVD